MLGCEIGSVAAAEGSVAAGAVPMFGLLARRGGGLGAVTTFFDGAGDATTSTSASPRSSSFDAGDRSSSPATLMSIEVSTSSR
jgi:hypothetical protein